MLWGSKHQRRCKKLTAGGLRDGVPGAVGVPDAGASRTPRTLPPRRLGRRSGPHSPGLQQQRGLRPLRGQVGSHRLGRGGGPRAEQREPECGGAQEQPHDVAGLRHGAEEEARSPRTRRPQPAATKLPPAPPAARPPTSGGGSPSPLLGPGPGLGRAHAPSALAQSLEPQRTEP